MTSTPSQPDSAADHKRRLLSQLLATDTRPAATNLTPEQRRLWLLRQLGPAVPWHVHSAIRVEGPLDVAAMQRALADIVQQHAILRTIVQDVHGRPMQVVPPAVALRLPIVDVGADDLDEAIAEEVTRTFDVHAGPLIRSMVLRVAAEDQTVVICAHRLVADQRSIDLLAGELFSRYRALLAGVEPAVTTAVDFGEYANRQAAWLSTPQAREQLAQWREALIDVPPLRIATGRVRPMAKTFPGLSRSVRLEAAAIRAVEKLAAGQGVTPGMVVLAAYVLLLSRSSGQRDFAVGLPAHGRPDADSATTIGPVENMLPVRFAVGTNQTFADWLTIVCEAVDAAEERGRVPFDLVVQEVDPPRDLSQTPLFQAAFKARDAAEGPATAADLKLRRMVVDTHYVTHDIEADVEFGGEGMVLRLTGNADLFDAATLTAMLQRLCLLLTGAAGDPARRLQDIPILTDAEKQQAVVEWNETRDDHPRDVCFHQLFERQAAGSPGSLAIRCGDADLTYGDLDARGNRLAHELRKLGVGPESRVAIEVDRSVHSIVALLGVLKAGAAYVPISPDAPAERVRTVLMDAGVVALVHGPNPARNAIRDALDLPVVAVPVDDGENPGTPDSGVQPHHLAYVIYTSGSTGRPKGVAVEHRQIVASTAARWAYADPAFDLLTLPLTFDAAAGGLHWTLSRGGATVIPTEQEAQDPRLLAQLIRRQPITHINSMHAHYRLILDATRTEDLAALRFVDVGGEALPPTLVAEHYRRSPDALLCNCYGPTEATVWATAHDCTPRDAAGVVPIGRPVRNTRVYLLDDNLTVVPPGIPGELWIGGEGVARGYLDDPQATAARFLPDPFAETPAARMYRTGDLARYRQDGTIEFLGRSDDQIKVRGFRVELGEIEKQLSGHPGVARACAVLYDDGLHQRLIGYFTPAKGDGADEEKLRNYLASRLPDYMIPAVFIMLDEMPMTAGGKVDRRALPSPTMAAGDDYIEPRTAVEDMVAKIFAELLGETRVSATADFFKSGGDSLLMARMLNQLARRYDVGVSLEEIFRVPTVAGIAYAIENQQQLREDVDADVAGIVQLDALRAELQLDPAVQPDGLPHADWLNPSHVLVTGATGYIGAFVVTELLNQTDATVHCLVRAENDEQAYARLEAAMRGFQTWDDSCRHRIRAVAGDLGEPNLGLSPELLEEFADSIDAIYHSGAMVNFVYSYEALRMPNVEGTVELLRLATRRKLKAMHHISTMDVWIGTHAKRPFLEVELNERPKLIPTSYARSKWVSEKLVSMAAARGVPIAIYRPWLIMGHRETGVAHTTDYLLVALKGFLEIGVLPAYNDLVNAVPVDFLAESIVRISRTEDATRMVYFHIGNLAPAPMMQVYEWVRSFGYDLPVVDYQDARHRALRVGPENPLFPLAPVLGGGNETLRETMGAETFDSIDPTMECRNFSQALVGTEMYCPPVDEQYVHRTLRYLVDSGYLPAPDKVPTPA
jgi:amino acid adenylation domain-containing protein/thioester reductase-like protein